MRIAAHQHQLLHGVRKAQRPLRHHRDAPRHPRARAARGLPAIRISPGGNQDSRQEADQCRLARGVGTDDPEDLTIIDGHARARMAKAAARRLPDAGYANSLRALPAASRALDPAARSRAAGTREGSVDHAARVRCSAAAGLHPGARHPRLTGRERVSSTPPSSRPPATTSTRGIRAVGVGDSVGIRGSRGARAQEVDEERGAAERGDHAHRQLRRRDEGTGERVGGEEEESSAEEGRGHEHAVVGAERHPERMGHDQAHEADRPDEGDRRAVSSAAPTKTRRFTRSASTPSWSAPSSPSASRLSGRDWARTSQNPSAATRPKNRGPAVAAGEIAEEPVDDAAQPVEVHDRDEHGDRRGEEDPDDHPGQDQRVHRQTSRRWPR